MKMLPTHINAVELNAIHRKENDKKCANGRELLVKNNSLIGRRLANNIPPIDINLPCDNTSIPSTSLIVSKSAKFLDIGFKNLSYTASTGLFKRKNKTILNGLNGEFKSGELTAIMGPSGAGKSTLMDILAGYTTHNVNGQITINGQERNLKRFRRQTAYIMQDHNLHSFITVMEAMHFSANLKIGSEMTQAEKKLRIRQILEAIGLYESRRTRTGKLSGGQKKRLAIALEIFDNPPVMFFDEPTSGLDSSTSTQVVMLLKKLAAEGRTIISTIHQPSKIVFDMFDHLFALADGQCIYTGATVQLVPFLAKLNLVCPPSYSPTDYLLEISTHDYGYQNNRLVAETMNGSQILYRKNHRDTVQNIAMMEAEKMTASGLITPVRAPHLPSNGHYYQPLSPLSECPADPMKKPKKIPLQLSPDKYCSRSETYATSFCRQLSLLLLRTTLVLWRDRSLTAMRLFIHVMIAILIGTLYFGIGEDASNVFNIFRYIFFSIMFLMFTAFSSVTLAFPLELPIVTREHFNRWYSLKAYYVAMTLADAPIQVGCILIYIIITYLMTSQPLEWFRFGLFFVICLMVALVAQSIGLAVGALFSVKNGAIFGPFFICPFLIFSGFFVQLNDAHPAMQWLFHASFLKYALEGGTLAIFGYERERMECSKLFCQFVLPKKFIKTVDMHNGDFMTAVIALVVIFFIFRFIAFYVMSFRVRSKR
ncbi:ATP-binding cassette sub-family G member 4-like [Bradysia coprophila]|uniref:ATP-binding cassette sub-family G member 4-like n=1 Tax=Bradysia coprophila TaxID=38358 RepID=UPI00187D9ABD|nr:ATP-binding cassette sub-family G member 4-like [Bradysia coprophila]XP_037042713.1 ATP-binding cassette sub-family G member 4-like [Bradysia coprophila]XP_037042714.1 ATP-binding cassette sub-family G member 4-like [Bradysia coprophila]XP_037042715.1 ATP-binding cassette sub-family G member 4-like [Bradysia coprophila]XP_037042716.1 ATP-binding cassette sub-family G member 4-like [Bradysia coprophila]